tara:strand:- start:479 stop:859 length:381 start_codon:yes stop_codon:yes gene_type:complete
MAKTAAGVTTTGKTGEALVKYGKFRDSLMKITPLVDKLNAKDKRAVAVMKSLQGFYPDKSEYSDSEIKKSILSRLGVASGKFDDYDIVGRDSVGRGTTRKEQKEKNPRGFKSGGKVHRGRKANYNG